MDKVNAIVGYHYDSYHILKVKPFGFIGYGGERNFLCFDYAKLATQWSISNEQLEFITSLDIQFKKAMCYYTEELEIGYKKVALINAEVLPALLLKLRGSGINPELDLDKEDKLIRKIIEVVKEKIDNGKN